MRAAIVVIVALPLIPLTILLLLMAKMRVHGRPDRLAEGYLAAWALFCLARLGTAIWWWRAVSRWVWWIPSGLLLLAGFVLLTTRIRRHPQAVLSPEAIARVKGWSAKVRRR